MNVTSNYYRGRTVHCDVIRGVESSSRRSQLPADASLDSQEPLRPSDITLFRLARHYQTVHRTLSAEL